MNKLTKTTKPSKLKIVVWVVLACATLTVNYLGFTNFFVAFQ